MSDRSREVDELDLRLSEIDRKLEEIQADLLGSLRGGPAVQREVTVSAGPFRDLAELRAFEQALAGLPGVLAASVRGYEGADRAVIDVQLKP